MLAVFSILVVVHSAFLFFYSFYGYWGGELPFCDEAQFHG